MNALIQKLVSTTQTLSRRVAEAQRHTVLHAAVVRKTGGVTYRAWFSDPARMERLVAPVTSFAWSLEVNAELVAPGGEHGDAHLVLHNLKPEDVAVFRARFGPTRDVLTVVEAGLRR
jgi:hypothetical protein